MLDDEKEGIGGCWMMESEEFLDVGAMKSREFVDVGAMKR